MREYLFRGKCLETGEWVYGFLERRPSPIQMPGYGGPWYIYVPPKDPDDNGGYYNVNPETIGQYTGMNDRNGKKIFEGDVVHWWDTACYIYKTDENDEPIPPEGAIFFMGYVDTRDNGFVLLDGVTGHFRFFDYQMEVIGNIFDNPELLEAIEA